MKNRIQAILKEEDPISRDMNTSGVQMLSNLTKFTVIYFIAVAIISITVASLVGEYLDHHSNLDVSFFGLNFSIDDDSFMTSWFVIFLYVFLFMGLLFTVVWSFLSIAIRNHAVKIGILNNTYRMNKLLELSMSSALTTQSKEQAATQAPATPQPNNGIPSIEEYIRRRNDGAL